LEICLGMTTTALWYAGDASIGDVCIVGCIIDGNCVCLFGCCTVLQTLAAMVDARLRRRRWRLASDTQRLTDQTILHQVCVLVGGFLASVTSPLNWSKIFVLVCTCNKYTVSRKILHRKLWKQFPLHILTDLRIFVTAMYRSFKEISPNNVHHILNMYLPYVVKTNLPTFEWVITSVPNSFLRHSLGLHTMRYWIIGTPWLSAGIFDNKLLMSIGYIFVLYDWPGARERFFIVWAVLPCFSSPSPPFISLSVCLPFLSRPLEVDPYSSPSLPCIPSPLHVNYQCHKP